MSIHDGQTNFFIPITSGKSIAEADREADREGSSFPGDSSLSLLAETGLLLLVLGGLLDLGFFPVTTGK